MKLIKNSKIIILFLITNLTLIGNVSAKDNEADVKAVQKALDTWLAAVASHDAEKVAALYNSDAILLPTLSSKVKKSPKERLDYFKEFTALPGIKGKVTELNTKVYDDIGINAGLYTFTYQKDGKTISVPARFGFVYDKTDKGWMIVYHHSSKSPEEIK
jgi:uncharacterized protein (TIGR02246 family)